MWRVPRKRDGVGGSIGWAPASEAVACAVAAVAVATVLLDGGVVVVVEVERGAEADCWRRNGMEGGGGMMCDVAKRDSWMRKRCGTGVADDGAIDCVRLYPAPALFSFTCDGSDGGGGMVTWWRTVGDGPLPGTACV